MPGPKADTLIAIRVPKSWLKDFDRLAKHMAETDFVSGQTRVSRSAAIRAAMRHGIQAVEDLCKDRSRT